MSEGFFYCITWFLWHLICCHSAVFAVVKSGVVGTLKKKLLWVFTDHLSHVYKKITFIDHTNPKVVYSCLIPTTHCFIQVGNDIFQFSPWIEIKGEPIFLAHFIYFKKFWNDASIFLSFLLYIFFFLNNEFWKWFWRWMYGNVVNYSRFTYELYLTF